MNAKSAGTVERDADISGRVDIQAGAVIRSGAVVRGPVAIGRDTVIEAETYIGPYTSIDENSIIADVHVENSIIVGGSEIRNAETLI